MLPISTTKSASCFFITYARKREKGKRREEKRIGHSSLPFTISIPTESRIGKGKKKKKKKKTRRDDLNSTREERAFSRITREKRRKEDARLLSRRFRSIGFGGRKKKREEKKKEIRGGTCRARGLEDARAKGKKKGKEESEAGYILIALVASRIEKRKSRRTRATRIVSYKARIPRPPVTMREERGGRRSIRPTRKSPLSRFRRRREKKRKEEDSALIQLNNHRLVVRTAQ